MKRNSSLRGQISHIRPFFKGYTHCFILALSCSVLHIIFTTLMPQITKITVDSVIGNQPLNLPAWLMQWDLVANLGSGKLSHDLLLCAAAVAGTALVAWILSYFFRVQLTTGSEGFINGLRNRLFDHIQHLPFAWHVRHQTGEIIQRCSSDVDVIRNFVSGQLLEVFRILFLITISMTMMFTMNVKISLIAMVFIPIVVTYSTIFSFKINKGFRKADEAEGALSASVQENLTGVRVVRAFGREQFEIERFAKRNNDYADLWLKLGHIMCFYWGIGDMVTGLQILTVITVGVIETVNGNISLGEFLAFVSYNTTLIWPVRSLGRVLSEMSKAGVSIDRVCYILEAEEEQDLPNAQEAPMDRDICFDHVSFDYNTLDASGQELAPMPVLRDVSVTIPAGSTFAILGDTGTGKSTLMHLLGRMYDIGPDQGKITVGGVDISKMKRSWVRRNVGIVLQEPFLFSRTIRENISAFRPEADFADVRAMAGIACVDEAIQDFDEGYDTIVGERGVTLSGGQKQRVAIARMLMQHAPIMVFDDSLSAVDSETDAKIRAALRESLGKSTVILISHRITTLMQAQTIMVLDGGRVAEIGSHEELLQKNGIYRSIYNIQMNSADRALLEKEGN